MQNQDLELLTIKDLSQLLRSCRTSIRADVRAGRPPAPIALEPRHRGWLRRDALDSLHTNRSQSKLRNKEGAV